MRVQILLITTFGSGSLRLTALTRLLIAFAPAYFLLPDEQSPKQSRIVCPRKLRCTASCPCPRLGRPTRRPTVDSRFTNWTFVADESVALLLHVREPPRQIRHRVWFVKASSTTGFQSESTQSGCRWCRDTCHVLIRPPDYHIDSIHIDELVVDAVGRIQKGFLS